LFSTNSIYVRISGKMGKNPLATSSFVWAWYYWIKYFNRRQNTLSVV